MPELAPEPGRPGTANRAELTAWRGRLSAGTQLATPQRTVPCMPCRQVAHLASEGKIGLRDQLLRVVGDVAWEVGVEYGEFKLAGRPVSVEHRVTNIYQREGEGWKLVHHHTDASPAMQEVLKQLQVASEPSASRA